MHYRFTMIVPLQNDDEDRVSEKYWRILHAKLREAFGGYTMHKCFGAWVNNTGNIILDDSHEYSVLAEDGWATWLFIAGFVQKQWRQESVLVSRAQVLDVQFLGESTEEPMDHNC